MVDNNQHYLVFTLSGKQFALPLAMVHRVVHAVAVTPLPQAPDIVCGLANFRGFIMPVLNISCRFKLVHEEITSRHHFVVVRTESRQLALVADEVAGVMEQSGKQVVPPENIVSGTRFLSGVIKLDDGMMLVPDLEHLLTDDEESALAQAMGKDSKKSKTSKHAQH